MGMSRHVQFLNGAEILGGTGTKTGTRTRPMTRRMSVRRAEDCGTRPGEAVRVKPKF